MVFTRAQKNPIFYFTIYVNELGRFMSAIITSRPEAIDVWCLYNWYKFITEGVQRKYYFVI